MCLCLKEPFFNNKQNKKKQKQKICAFLFVFPSSMGHVKSRVNQRGPPRKAKYF